MQFGVNHLGHFLLTNLLLDKLKEVPSGRIVVVSSLSYKWGRINFDDINSENSYNPRHAYGQSKLANNLFTVALAERLQGTNVTVNCLLMSTKGLIDSRMITFSVYIVVVAALIVPVVLLSSQPNIS